MNDSDKILDALRKVYAQNQELQTKLDSLTQYLQDAMGTPTHDYPQQPVKRGKRPWEQGWSKDKVAEESSSEEIPETIKDTFKL